jgi:hypothetical protein
MARNGRDVVSKGCVTCPSLENLEIRTYLNTIHFTMCRPCIDKIEAMKKINSERAERQPKLIKYPIQ